MAYDLKEGELLIKAARDAITHFFEKKKEVKLKATKPLLEKRGVFVTLERRGELRGCIGYPRPTLPLMEAVMDAAIHATRDSRFRPMDVGEIKDITIEVTVLGEMEQLKGEPRTFAKQIRIGKHGLYADAGVASGLLLPQVAVDEGWGEEEFLSQVCWKAGLEPSAWMDPAVRIYRFDGQIFSEEKPAGKVVEKKC